MSIKDRGFGSLNPARMKEIASLGGVAAHKAGTAHTWDEEEAREAGRKGGIASAKAKKRRAEERRRQNEQALQTQGEQG